MIYSPWYLTLLLLLPYFAWRLGDVRRKSALRFSTTHVAQLAPPTFRQRCTWLPRALTIAALAFVVLGLARPRHGQERTVTESEGIAIEMVVDRSGSMNAMDFRIEGEHVDRLTAIKNVAGNFVGGSDGLSGRFSDLVGLITFAGFADGVTPPTLDHAFLVGQLHRTEIVTSRSEDGTAIGDALALAVEKLNSLDDRQDKKVKSKVIILLTDGENNAGELEPLQAAEVAKTMGMRVYTIGVGTQGEAPMPTTDPFSGRRVFQMVQVTIDEATLQQVAALTGGRYFRATDTDSLSKIYQEIDQLEKSNVEAQHYVDYRELAVQPYPARWITIPPLLLIAFALCAGRIVLQETWLREVN